jgi:zinc protease
MTAKPHTLRTEVAGVPLIVEHSPALPLVSISVARRGGAILDPNDLEGMTRLHSRLSRRTAGGRPLQAIEEDLDRLGASLGSEVSYSSVSLSGATITRSVDAFVDLIVDAVSRPSLELAEFERLKRESRAEIIEGFDNDRSLAGRALRRALFPGHAYSRTASGTLACLDRMSHESVVKFDVASRTSSGLVIGLSGDIGLEHAARLAERIVESMPRSAGLKVELTDPELRPGRHLVIVDKPDRSQTQILIGLGGTKPTDADHTALHVGMTVFGGTFSSRLMQQIRVERGWSYGAYATLPIDRHRQALTLWTFPSKSEAAACAKLMLELLETIVEKGITPKELSFAKKSLVRSHAFSVDTASKRLGMALDAALLELPERYYEDYEQRVSAVTLDEANAAMRTRLDPSRLVISMVGSATELEPEIRAALPNIETVSVVPFESRDL